MTPPICRLAAALASAMLAALATLASIPAAEAASVAADEDDDLVAVELHTLEPAAPSAGDTVTIDGTITNRSEDPLENVQALFRYSSQPIQARTEIAELPADPQLYWGWRPGHIFDTVTEVLDPGESAEFHLEVTLRTACVDTAPGGTPCLAIPNPGVYAIGVDANVTPAGHPRQTGGTARTVLPWNISTERTVDVSVLWPLAGAPVATGQGGEDLSAQLVPGSALRTLVDAVDDEPVTWAIDPDLVTAACAVGNCTEDDSTPEESDRNSDAVQDWLAALADATADSTDIIGLPASVPDIGTLARIDPDVATDVAEQSADASELSGTGAFSGLTQSSAAWPTGEDLETELAIWTAAGFDTVVLPAAAVTGPEAASMVHLATADTVVTAVLTDHGLDSAIADSLTNNTSAARLDLRQRWLAETAFVARDPFTPKKALVTAPPVGWQPSSDVVDTLLETWMQTEWINPVGLGKLGDGGEPSVAELNADFVAANGAGLPTDYARDVVSLHAEIGDYQALLADPDVEDAPGEPAASSLLTSGQAASIVWRTDLDTAQTQLSDLRQMVRSFLEDVSIVVNPTNTLSSNTGVFPVNIANNLDHAVDVRLEFEPANQDRMSIEQIEPQRVEAGEQQTVQVRAEAVANGQVPVAVQLATVDGAPLGSTQRTIINATQYGTIGWLVVGGSALLFAGGLSWRMVRGRRRNGSDYLPGDTETTVDQMGVADKVTR